MINTNNFQIPSESKFIIITAIEQTMQLDSYSFPFKLYKQE